MIGRWLLIALVVGAVYSVSSSADESAYPPELAAMVQPLEEVEAMLADGTFVDGEFSLSVSGQHAATFANTIKKKLRTAKAEYSRSPRAVRTTPEADKQWYRMDALIKQSEGFSAARQRHAKALAEQQAQSTAVAASSAAPASAMTSAPAQSVEQAAAGAAGMSEAEMKAAERKRQAEAHAAAVRAQQEAIRARAAEVQAEKRAAAAAKAAGVEPTGDDWQNSFIPNIEELRSRDGFFQWPWSAPSWQAVVDKAAIEQQKGALGTAQVERFKTYVLDQADKWPAAPRIEDAGDAGYALDMIRAREDADGLQVVDLWISRPSWKIQRNSLGVILSRTKPGYLLYKDPSDQGCILKQLWIKEPYAGGTNYEKASSWRYAKLRFQSCDRG